MSDFLTYPREDAFDTTLASDINSSVLTVVLNTAPSFTLTGSNRCYIVIDYDNNLREIAKVQSISGATLTLESRGIAAYDGGSSTAAAHSAGAKVVISDTWKTWEDIYTAIASKAEASGGTFTGPVDFSGASTTFTMPNLTTAERDALTPTNGMLIYNTTSGEFQYYDGGAWNSVGTASVPNGSETVAGVWEGSTVAEQGTQSATGGTGAGLVLQPQHLVKTSSGAGDENKLAILDSSGDFADGFIPQNYARKDVLTAKGSLYVGTAASTPADLPVGTNGDVLIAASAETEGVKWADSGTLLFDGRWVNSGAIINAAFSTAGGFTVSGSYQMTSGSSSSTSEYTTAGLGDFMNLSNTAAILYRIGVGYAAASDQTVDMNWGIGDSTGSQITAYNSTADNYIGVAINSTDSTETLYTKVSNGVATTNTSLGSISSGSSASNMLSILITATSVWFQLDGGSAVEITTNIPTISNLSSVGCGFIETVAEGSSRTQYVRVPAISYKAT